MQFAYPESRYFLVLAFAVAALAVFALVRKRRALRRLARQGIHQPGMLVRPSLQILKCMLLSFAAVLLGIAVLGPQWGWTEEEVPPRHGRDVLIALDVSRSMLAEDATPNRLERAKTDLRNLAGFLERAGGYRIGLITFAEHAAVVCPLTSDYRCFDEELAAASLKSLRLRGHAAWGDGTQISHALERAGQTIDEANAAYTDVLLVSDGEDMARETLAMAESLARRSITVHTFGLGDAEHGSLIPVYDSLGRPAHLRYRGEWVYTRLQETILRAIAETTHGRYFAAATNHRDLDRQVGELLAGKKNLQRQTSQRQRHGIHRFACFVAPALLLLLLHELLSDARRPGCAAPGPPNYFSWVRRRTNDVLSSLCLLWVLWVSVVHSSPPEGPWAAFRRGNELLLQAQQAGTKAEPAALLRAMRQYQVCLSCPTSTPNTGTLFADARHNLEMAKLLLMQVSRGDDDAGRPDPDAPPSPTQGLRAIEATAKGQSPSQAQRQQQRSQGQSEDCSICQTGQIRSAKASKKMDGEQGSRPGKGAPLSPGPIPGDRGESPRSANAVNSSPGGIQGTMPAGTSGKDMRQEDGRAPGAGREKTARTKNAAMQAAELRLQEAIQRIETRRSRRESGPEISPEDPANQNRYRDW
jgi:Ca-activated chloride channel family protein